MPANRGAFNLFLAPGAYDAFADQYEKLPARYPEVFNVLSTQRAFEDFLISTGLGTTPVKPEGQNVAMDQPYQVGSVRMIVVSYGLGYEVHHELMQDDLYNVVVGPASRFLADSGRDTEERQTWGLLNNAFTTTTSYDGVSIINTAHPLKGGGTYANRPASAQTLSFTSLQASLERHMLMVNERGLKVRQRPEMLVVPVQLSWMADEILGSQQKPFTANNEPNVLAAGRIGMRTVASEYLTSTTAWFTGVAKGKHRLSMFWREKPNMDDDFDKKARVAQFFNFFRFGTVAADWRGWDGDAGV